MTHVLPNMTSQILSSLNKPATSVGDDLPVQLSEVLASVGMDQADTGGRISFYGQDPIVPSCFRFGALSAVSQAAKATAAAAIWRDRTGEGQDIHVDMRKTLRRFAAFFERRWETINGKPPSIGSDPGNPFLASPLFHQTRDGRWMMPLNVFPRLRSRATAFLRCGESRSAVANAILQWNGLELEEAGAEIGIVMPMLRTTEEFMRELQYTENLVAEPLIRLEKIGESEPVPFSDNPTLPLSGIRALGLGHVIAGSGIGRDLSLFGADVLNVWQPLDSELDPFYYTSHVGMRSTILDMKQKTEQAIFDALLKTTDIFFANRRPGYLERYGLTAEELAFKRPGLIHAKVTLHGEKGPWSDRVGFDEVGGAVSGVFFIDGTPDMPSMTPINIVCDYVTGWLATVGVLAALRRRAKEGGSYRVVVSLTRATLWLLALGIFEKQFAHQTAGSSDEHTYVPPDLFTAETPLGTYQGLTEGFEMSRMQQSYRTVLVPRGSSRPEWLGD